VQANRKKGLGRRRQRTQQTVRLNVEEELLLTKWSRRMLYLGVALAASVGSVFPFLSGYPLHDHWKPFGVSLTLLSMVLLSAFLSTAGMTFFFWWYSEKRWRRKRLLR
jgi:hypothetical protein